MIGLKVDDSPEGCLTGLVRGTLHAMALVCLCYGVNERRIRREIEHGASTVEEIARRCQAGGCCQSCHPTLDDLLAERSAATAARHRRFVVA